MNVLIINPILYTSETDQIPKVSSIKDTMIYALCMGFLKNGDMPTLLAAKEFQPQQEESYPFEVIWLPCRWKKIFKPKNIPWMKGLSRFLKDHGKEYDYIISSEVFAMHTLSANIYCKKKLIIWHELGAHNRLCKQIPSKIWYNLIAGIWMRNTMIVPRSEKAAGFIRRFCKNVQPVWIDHGVNLEQIQQLCMNEDSAPKEDYFVVLSQLIERKHIDQILVQFARFLRKDTEKNQNYQLKIIGDGVLKKQLQDQAKELKINDHVLFTGKLSHQELLPILAKAKGMLIYTSKDNSMVSITESIACLTPVLTTSIPFNAPYIQREELGIVKDFWTEQELEKLVLENERYVQNCLKYREKLDNSYMAKQFNQMGETLKQ